MTQRAPYGTWQSPITAAHLAEASLRLGLPTFSAGGVYWLEGRPTEQGRNVLVRREPDGTVSDVTPAGYNVRTRVHEYGGGAYVLDGDTVFFSNFADQRLYRQEPGREPEPITPEPHRSAAWRYADAVVTPDGTLLLCVRERHDDGEVVNELVAVPSDGSHPPVVLAGGRDFYSSPRLDPTGTRLAWLSWDHPQMPWDGTELWVATLVEGPALGDPKRVAGSADESIFQPSWSPQGDLHFVSDRTGWWNLFRGEDEGAMSLAPMEVEFGWPQWTFGMSRYAFLSGGGIVVVYAQGGFDHLAVLEPGGQLQRVDTELSVIAPGIATDGEGLAWVLGGSPTRAPMIAEVRLSDGTVTRLRSSIELDLDPDYVSVPQPIEFPTEDGLTAHAFYYPPHHPDYQPPPGELPPLLVLSHGGPTGATAPELEPGIQYWTTRGLAVVDVNYGGSTGYGREYRNRLRGRWGIVDVNDCVNAARHLAEQGKADPDRLAIRGGSAGGYCTLAALTFHDTFAAGASYFGVADLEALARDTHKFESRYLDGLVGPYPETAAVYRERSPLFHSDRIACPVILFQGLEDRVVPPNQAEGIVAALDANRIPHAYLTFPEEDHGFRRADSIRRSREAELCFYGRVFGFQPADPLPPVPIQHLA